MCFSVSAESPSPQETSDPSRFKAWHERSTTTAYRQSLTKWQQTIQRRSPHGLDRAWQPLKPAIAGANRQMTGRISALHQAPDPDHPGEIVWWVGASSGGLWVRDAVSQDWKHLSDNLPASPAVGDFAVLASGRIVLATGDPWRYPGSGIYVSDNAGGSWQMASMPVVPASIYRLTVDSKVPGRIFAATPDGLMLSSDAGATWRIVHAGHFTDIKQDHGLDHLWYAGAFEQGVLISSDNGDSFTISDGVKDILQDPIGRVSLAPSPARNGLVFALVADFGNTQAILRSTDHGTSWSDINNGDAVGWGQAFHTSAIAAHPQNPDTLIIAHGAAKRTDNATGATPVWSDAFDTGHADNTHILWPSSDVLMVSNDGGLFMLDPVSHAFDGSLNEGLGILQIFDTGALDVDPLDPDRAWIGTQDNGVARIELQPVPVIRSGSGGDGGWVTASVGPTDRVAAAIGLDWRRRISFNGGDSFNVIHCVDAGPGNPPLAFDPLPVVGQEPLLYATEAGNDQDHARLVQFDFSRSCPTFVRSRTIPDSLGFSNRLLNIADHPDQLIIYMSPAANAQDPRLARAQSLPGFRESIDTIVRLDPPVPRSGRLAALTARPDEAVWWSTQGEVEVWHSADRGNPGSWQSLTGNLAAFGAGLKINRVDGHPRIAGEYYLATNLGVLVSRDHGGRWQPFGNGLPAVIDVVELQVAQHPDHPEEGVRLWLASYGYGVWTRQLIDHLIWADGFETNN